MAYGQFASFGRFYPNFTRSRFISSFCYSLTVLRSLTQSLLEVTAVHDVVPLKYLTGLVAGDFHGDGFRYTQTSEVPDRRPSKIVEQQPRYLSTVAHRSPQLVEGFHGHRLRDFLADDTGEHRVGTRLALTTGLQQLEKFGVHDRHRSPLTVLRVTEVYFLRPE